MNAPAYRSSPRCGRPTRPWIPALLLALCLGACGGGGGRDPVPEQTATLGPAAQIWATVRDAADTRWVSAFTGTTSTVFQFFGQGAEPTGGTLTYEWDFEFTGVFSPASLEPATNAQSPEHTFSTVGTRTIALRVTGASGSSTAFCELTIAEAAPTNAAPSAQVRAFTLFGAKRFEVQFRAEGVDPDGGGLTDIRWDFDGDGSEDGLDADGNTTAGNDVPRHIYDEAGVYSATVTLTDDEGSRSTATVVVVVCENRNGSAPSAMILLLPPEGSPSTDAMPAPVGVMGARIRLLAVGSDADGITGPGCTVDWDLDMNGTFGDEDGLPVADVANNGRLITIPLLEGMQRIRMRVTDDESTDPTTPGAPNTSNETDIVLFGTGGAASTGPAVRVWAETAHMAVHPCVGVADALPKGIQFHAEALDPDMGGTVSYVWTFGDEGLLTAGCVEGATTSDPIHAYETPGVYYATVTAIGSTAPASLRTTVVLPILVGNCLGPLEPGDICVHGCIPRYLSLPHGGGGQISLISCCSGALSIKSYEVLRIEGMAMGLSCGPFGIGVDLGGADITTMPARLDENPATPPTPTAAAPFPFLGCQESSIMIQSGRIPAATECCVFPYRVLVRLRDPGKLVQIVACPFDVFHGCVRGNFVATPISGDDFDVTIQVEIEGPLGKAPPLIHALELDFASQNPPWVQVDLLSIIAPLGWDVVPLLGQFGDPLGIRLEFVPGFSGGPLLPPEGPLQLQLQALTLGGPPQQGQVELFIPGPGIGAPLVPLGSVPLPPGP